MANYTLIEAALLYTEGWLLNIQRQFNDAAAKFRLCAQIRLELLGRHTLTARAFNMLAIQYRPYRSSPVSREESCWLLIEARAMLEEQPDFSVYEVALIMQRISYVCYESRQKDDEGYLRAEELAFQASEYALGADLMQLDRQERDRELNNAVNILEQVYGDDSLEVARAIVAIAERTSNRAFEYFTRAVQIVVHKLGPDDLEVANVRMIMGFYYESNGQKVEAQKHYKEALRIYIAQSGVDSISASQARRHLLNFAESNSPEEQRLTLELARYCPIKEEIRVAAKWWTDRLRTIMPTDGNDGFADDQLEAFQHTLAFEAMKRFSIAMIIGLVDGQPCTILATALLKAEIDGSRFSGKCRSVINVGKVTVYPDGVKGLVIFEK